MTDAVRTDYSMHVGPTITGVAFNSQAATQGAESR